MKSKSKHFTFFSFSPSWPIFECQSFIINSNPFKFQSKPIFGSNLNSSKSQSKLILLLLLLCFCWGANLIWTRFIVLCCCCNLIFFSTDWTKKKEIFCRFLFLQIWMNNKTHQIKLYIYHMKSKSKPFIMVMGLDQKMSFCEGLMMTMMMKGLDWIWKWVYYFSPFSVSMLKNQFVFFQFQFPGSIFFFFSFLFCWVFSWRLMRKKMKKLNEGDDLYKP